LKGEIAMKLRPVVGLYGILEATEEGGDATNRLLSAVSKGLQAEGMEVKPSPVIVSDDQTAVKAARFFQSVEPDLLVSVVITWSFDSLHLTILKRVPLPLAVIAVPGIRSGSIVGAHQLGSLLSDLGKEYAVFYGPEDDPKTYQPITAYALAAAARLRLEMGKLGFVGRRTPGMTPIAFDEVEITRRFGPLMELFGWEEIEELAQAVSKGDVSAQMDRLRAAAGSMDSSEASLEHSVRLLVALRELARRNRILAYGIGCYPHYAGRACLTVGMLTEDGIPAGCEGDLNSALAMYLLQSFTGAPAHFGEILEVNEEQNSIVTSHCGCGAPSLAARPASVTLTPVRIFHRGISIRYPSKAAPEATYVNLTGRSGTYRMCAIGGSAVETAMVFEGNPVSFRPTVPVRRLLDLIGKRGFGHHWMMGYGDARAPLARFCAMNGVDLSLPDEGT
jgi:L-fucose isomerase-like protein